MMCLGWSAAPTCNATDTIQVSGGSGSGSGGTGGGGGALVPLTAGAGTLALAAAGGAPCADVTWFWLAAAAILGAGVLKGHKKR